MRVLTCVSVPPLTVFQSNPTSSREYARLWGKYEIYYSPFQSNPTSSREYAMDDGACARVEISFNPTRPVAGNMRRQHYAQANAPQFQSNPTSSREYAGAPLSDRSPRSRFNPTRPVAGNMRETEMLIQIAYSVSIQPDQ